MRLDLGQLRVQVELAVPEDADVAGDMVGGRPALISTTRSLLAGMLPATGQPVALFGIGMLGLAGIGLFMRKTWAGVAGIMIAMLSALANFFFIPYYPIWSLLLIGLNIWVIWALTRPGAIET